MEQQKKLSVTLEIIFWIVTVILCIGVLYPIHSSLNSFPFMWTNSIAIIVFVTYTRYVFLWQYTLFSRSTIVRIIFIVAAIPLVFYLIQNMNSFQSYLDDSGYDAFMDLSKRLLSDSEKTELLQYIRSEFIFFSTGAVVKVIVLALTFTV